MAKFSVFAVLGAVAVVVLSGCREDPDAAANRLAVEAIPLWTEYRSIDPDDVSQLQERLAVLQRIERNLSEIVSSYPQSALAVELVARGSAQGFERAQVVDAINRVTSAIERDAIGREMYRECQGDVALCIARRVIDRFDEAIAGPDRRDIIRAYATLASELSGDIAGIDVAEELLRRIKEQPNIEADVAFYVVAFLAMVETDSGREIQTPRLLEDFMRLMPQAGSSFIFVFAAPSYIFAVSERLANNGLREAAAELAEYGQVRMSMLPALDRINYLSAQAAYLMAMGDTSSIESMMPGIRDLAYVVVDLPGVPSEADLARITSVFAAMTILGMQDEAMNILSTSTVKEVKQAGYSGIFHALLEREGVEPARDFLMGVPAIFARPDDLLELSASLLAEGDRDGALQPLDRAGRLILPGYGSDREPYLPRLMELSFTLGLADQAELIADEIQSEIDPDDAGILVMDTYLGLARYRALAGDLGEARQLVERFREIAGREAQERLPLRNTYQSGAEMMSLIYLGDYGAAIEVIEDHTPLEQVNDAIRLVRYRNARLAEDIYLREGRSSAQLVEQ